MKPQTGSNNKQNNGENYELTKKHNNKNKEQILYELHFMLAMLLLQKQHVKQNKYIDKYNYIKYFVIFKILIKSFIIEII